MNTGWYAILRSGILDHLLAGKLGYPEIGIYTTIHLQADFKTGIWRGSAPRLLAAAPRGASIRDVQRWLQILTRIRFLRPFHRHGERGNYPVLIDKYDVRIGALKGMRLNAWASTSWEQPCYEVCALGDAEDDAVPVAVDAPSSVFSSQKAVKQQLRVLRTEDSVWGFLGLNPCGPPSFRGLLESRWSNRNGDRPSVLIGETIDAWEVAEGEKLRRTPRLFQALAEIRSKEKTSFQSQVEEPIRTLSHEDIPA